jgi:hypothetical protein
LQNYKSKIPDFNTWYGNYVGERRGKRCLWQERLFSDPLMRWLVNARNKIEKQGDLESHSLVRAEILCSYLDEGPRIEIPADLFQTVDILLSSIKDHTAAQYIVQHGALRIQRRWVENTLSDYELLDATAVAYGRLAELVYDAHRQIGLEPPDIIHDDAGTSYDLPAMGWRLPCMIAHEMPRSLTISISDGSGIKFETESVISKINQEDEHFLRNHDNGTLVRLMQADHNTPEELGAAFFAVARAIFLRDGYHVSALFLLRDRRLVRTIEFVVENTQQKYAVVRELATEATKSGADTAILVGEVWSAPASELKPYERPADSPHRGEQLALNVVGKHCDPLSFCAAITRDGERLILGETVMSRIDVPFMLAPFYHAWGREIPREWMDRGRAVIEIARQR